MTIPSTPIAPPLPIVDCRGSQSDLEALYNLDVGTPLWESLPDDLSHVPNTVPTYELVARPLDLTKCKLSKGTLRNVLRKERVQKNRNNKKGAKGKKHYHTRRKALRLRNYQMDEYFKRVQGEYRQTLWGRYKFRQKKAKDAGVAFNLTFEEFVKIHLGLGVRPGTDILWYKYLGSDKRYSLQMSRIDKKVGWQVDNIEFKYMGKHLAFAKNPIDSEPIKNEGV